MLAHNRKVPESKPDAAITDLSSVGRALDCSILY